MFFAIPADAADDFSLFRSMSYSWVFESLIGRLFGEHDNAFIRGVIFTLRSFHVTHLVRSYFFRNELNPLMHKVAKIVTWNNGVRRHTGLTHGF